MRSTMIMSCLRMPLRRIFGTIIPPNHQSYNSRVSFLRLYASSTAPEMMKKHGVVPDIIPTAPKDLLKVSFRSGAVAEGGNSLAPTQVKDPPEISYNADPKLFYLLCMIDPDSPSRGRPTFREWHHWLVGNIPGNDVKNGEVLSEYISPCPPRGTGVHRFVFLVYKQSGKLKFDEPRLTNKRSNNRELFKIKKFADKYKLGDPIAGNLFQAEWDEYVEVIYENLSKIT